MKKLGLLGFALAALGFVGREYFHLEAAATWMHQAFAQGTRAEDSDAPINYFHADWPLSQGIELIGYGSLAGIAVGLGLIAYDLVQKKP